MRIADEVTMRVKAEIEGHRMLGATLLQKAVGAVVGGIVVASGIVNVLRALGH